MTIQIPTSHDEALASARLLAAQFSKQASERDLQRRLPSDEVQQFSDSGLWAITLPLSAGGPDLPVKTLTGITAEISAADGSLGQIPQNHFYVLEFIRLNGSPAQQEYLFGLIHSGARFANALAEVGSRNQSEQRTRLTSGPDGLTVTGTKFYATGSPFADWIPTSVIDDSGDMQLVFIPADAPGLSIHNDWTSFGQKTTGSGTIILDQVTVKPEWVVPMQSAFDRPTAAGPFAQILHAAIDFGIARGAMGALLDFVRKRARAPRDSGVEFAYLDPLLLERVGRLQIQLDTADLLIEKAAAAVEKARRSPNETSVAEASYETAKARVVSDEAALAISSQLFELSGAQSTLQQYGLDRYWRDAPTHTLHDAVRWKLPIIGNQVLNNIAPPRHGKI